MASTLTISFSIIFFFFFILSHASDMSIITYDNNHNTKIALSRRSDDEVMALFESWLVEHGKVYKAIGEKERRFKIFKNNLKFIDEHNSVDRSYKVGLNQYADITNEEFRAKYLSPRKDQKTRMDNRKLRGLPPAPKPNLRVTAPNSIDWREKGAVGPVREQGLCGFGSWAFAAVAAVESAYQIKTGKLKRLSVQELLDCDKNSQGCFGGSTISAYQYMIDNKGIAAEVNYPYQGLFGFCKKVKKAVAIFWYASSGGDERWLKDGVADQPASVVIGAGSISFQFYQSGIFNGDCGSLYEQSVTVVGYKGVEDDVHGDYDEAPSYWIVQNSWGTKWGEEGFMRLKSNMTSEGLGEGGACGIAKEATFPVFLQ